MIPRRLFFPYLASIGLLVVSATLSDGQGSTTAAVLPIAADGLIWGKDKVESELPLRAALKGNVWTVIGNPHLHGGETGGDLIIQLDRRTGAVIAFLHSK
jgi:hypothetical protein